MKLSIVILLIVLLGAAMANNAIEQKFLGWAKSHGKKYANEDELRMRLDIFKNNLITINEHNNKNKGFTLGLNQFADMTNEEYKMKVLGTKFDANTMESKITRRGSFPKVTLPSTVDWRKKNAVTHIKNQGQCGSCWSFSTTGSTEGAFALSTGNLLSFSEQQLVDCSGSYGNNGCNGGLMTDAFQYIVDVGGIELESGYPYTATQGTCHSKKSLFKGDITSFVSVARGSETDLQTASANIGPISVAIDASHSSFQLYSGGVYYEPNCSPTQLDHGVLVVGYGTDGSSPYWLVKNSWGTTWGLDGYIMMSRNKNNNCGIATMASYPTGAKTPSTKFEAFLKLEGSSLKAFDPTA